MTEVEPSVLAPANDMEQKVLEVYQLLKDLSIYADAPPCVTCNAQKALAVAWQMVNDLGLSSEQLFEYGV